MNAIYEMDFLGFSYGFRPGRSPHQALDALSVGIMTKKVSWVLDADIRGFFDTLNHEWLVKFIEHRIADRRIVRLIQKWLNAGVLEEGKRIQSEVGTVQGGSISPLLANIYLHYVFDLWVHRWRKNQAKGDVIVVRFADDFVVGFQHQSEAQDFFGLRSDLPRFGLELHPEKTRLIEFGRFAAQRPRTVGERENRRPSTFSDSRTSVGRPEGESSRCFGRRCGRGGKQSSRRSSRTLASHARSVPEQGAYLRSVVRGHVATTVYP